MNPDRVRERGLRFSECHGAVLRDVALVFDKVSRHHPDEAHANIRHAPGSLVEGVIYVLEGPLEITKMDVFESAPVNYGRDVVWVDYAEAVSDVGRIPAWTYFANPAVRRTGLKPSRAYLDHLLAGRPYLSAGYADALAEISCRGD